MNFKQLGELIARISAVACAKETFSILIEYNRGWEKLTFTFETEDGIKFQLVERAKSSGKWQCLIQFYELCEFHVHNKDKVSDDQIIEFDGSDKWLALRAGAVEDYIGYTSHGIEEVELTEWEKREKDEYFRFFWFDPLEFETYHEATVSISEWFHLKAAALIARQNSVRRKTKYPALAGINISAVNHHLEISAMCDRATTYRLLWREEPFDEPFSFTIPVELIDHINRALDGDAVWNVRFMVNPEEVWVKVIYAKSNKSDEGIEMKDINFCVPPVSGRYWYPKVPINQITEKSVGIKTHQLKEALEFIQLDSGKGCVLHNQILLQVQDEQLYIHGLGSSYLLETADCRDVQDASIHLDLIQLLDMIKYIPSETSIFLEFPDKITQALMIGNCTGIQYLVFGQVKGEDFQVGDLLSVPGILPGEPDLLLRLVEEPLALAMSEEESLLDAQLEREAYSCYENWQFWAAVENLCDRLDETLDLVDGCTDPVIKKQLYDFLYDYSTMHVKRTNGIGDVYRPDPNVCVESQVDDLNAAEADVRLLNGRVQQLHLNYQRTYSVRMTFA